ncbi:competence protein CoiA [Solibacillus sp. FSL H8-0538]|uniref:competence protein CoiA n=1 Tax=Solibacillus sp. FSL H8-0538 TaxID=2921400 RepID=UPI0030F79B32
MLVALTEEEELFQLTPSIAETTLRQLRQTALFYCPQCKERLLLKIGKIKVPHFAHLKNSACESTFSEGESITHLLGKQQFHTFFQHLKFNVVLEPYLTKLQQRPDLLVTTTQRSFAIEFQCSRIAAEQFAERTQGYVEHGIVPIWILQTPNAHFKQAGVVKISLNHFVQQFIITQNKQRYLLTYDAHSEQFFYVSNLLPVYGQQYFGFVQILPLCKQVFPFYIPSLLTEHVHTNMLSRYIQYKDRHVKARLLLSRKGVNDLLLRSIYELRLSREELPCFIGIPVRHSEAIPLFSVEWQIALFYFMHCHSLTPQKLSEQAIPYFFKWAKMSYCVEAGEAVRHYIQLLKKLHIQHVHSVVAAPLLFRELYCELVAFGCEN